jgi:LmbE family N-acetylglucosaminyl deacetylase
MRVNETLKADKIVGVKETIFFGLNEGNFIEGAKENNIHSKIQNLIKKYKPVKIFTHTSSDPHPDHKITEKLVLTAFDSIRYHCDFYTFDVWNPLNIKSSTSPKLVVDISNTFKTKLRALKCFKSQKVALFSLLWSVYYRAILIGLKHQCQFAESFHKIR